MSTHTYRHTQTYVVSRVACRNVSSVYCHTGFCIHPFSCVIVKHTKKKKYKKTDADKQTQGAKYITIHYKPPPQHFHKNLSRKSEQQMLSRFKVIAKIQSGFLGGPLLLRIQWADYIAILLPWWWNSIYWTTKCMQFYLQKHSVDPYSSKMKSVHSISQNTFL